MLKNEYVNIKINRNNKKYYQSCGFEDCKEDDIINIHYSLILKRTKHLKLIATCDYCGEDNEIEFYNYIRQFDSTVKKYACKKCKGKKIKESNMINYGVDSVMKLIENKEKLEQTMLNKYGVKHAAQKECFKDKMKKTTIQKYGVDNITKLPETIEKRKRTNLKRYGVENYTQTQEYKIKTKRTSQEKYGVDNVMQLKEIKDIVTQKGLKTKFKYGSQTCSIQQKYIHSLIGGKLNYPINKLSLDIAFPNEKIYIEYNGGGHDLNIKLKNMTEKEFKNKEIRRYYFLKSLGWKGIFINSPKDYLPCDDDLINKIKESINILNTQTVHHVNININDEYEIKDLRKIKTSTII